jgi:hypothetical protein
MNFRGTWFTGVEISAFAKDYADVPARIPSPTKSPAYSLAVPTYLHEETNPNNLPGPLAYQINFVGRLLLRSENQSVKTIVVDRVVSIRRVPVSPILPTPERR